MPTEKRKILQMGHCLISVQHTGPLQGCSQAAAPVLRYLSASLQRVLLDVLAGQCSSRVTTPHKTCKTSHIPGFPWIQRQVGPRV